MRWTILASGLALGLVALTGCIKSDPGYYLPPPDAEGDKPERGSIADLNQRLGKGTARPEPSPKPERMSFLVVHDAAGKAVYVELVRSSGDSRLDQRAWNHIMATYKSPPGEANTVMVSLEPKDVPKQ